MKKNATPKSSAEQQQIDGLYHNNDSRADLYHEPCLYWMKQAKNATHVLDSCIRPCFKPNRGRIERVLKKIAIQHSKVIELIEDKEYVSARLAMYHIENLFFTNLALITCDLSASRKEKIESAAFVVFSHYSNAARQLGSINDPNGAIPFRAKGVR